MGLCESMSMIFMIAINVIFGLVGICIIGVSSYGLATFASFEDYISRTGLIIGVCFGIFTTLISFIGCFGAIKKNKVMLGIYMFFELIVTVLLGAAAVVVLVWGGSLQRADTETGRDISNVITFSFMSCCREKLGEAAVLKYGPYVLDGTNSTDVQPCQPPAYAQPTANLTVQTTGQYLNTPTLLAGCYFPKCTSSNAAYPNYCSRIGRVEIANAGNLPGVPQEMCSGIKHLVFGGEDVTEVAACQAGLASWGGRVNTELSDNMHLIGIALSVITVMLLLLFVASVALCCTHSDKFDATA